MVEYRRIMKGVSMNKKYNKGFTLMELIVVISILAALALLLIPSIIGYTARAKEEVCKLNRQEIKQEIMIYANDNSDFYTKIGTNDEIFKTIKDLNKIHNNKLKCSAPRSRYVAFYQKERGVVVLCTEHSPEARSIRVYDEAFYQFGEMCNVNPETGKCRTATLNLTGNLLMKKVAEQAFFKDGNVFIDGAERKIVIDSTRPTFGTNFSKTPNDVMVMADHTVRLNDDWYVKYIYDDGNNVWYKFNTDATQNALEKTLGRRMGNCGPNLIKPDPTNSNYAVGGSKIACLTEVRTNPALWTRMDPDINLAPNTPYAPGETVTP